MSTEEAERPGDQEAPLRGGGTSAGDAVAALIMGLGVSAAVYHPAAWASALGTVVNLGFVVAAVLAWSVFRSYR